MYYSIGMEGEEKYRNRRVCSGASTYKVCILYVYTQPLSLFASSQ